MFTLDYITRLTKNIPISRKLIYIVLLTTNVTLLLASIAVVLYDRQSEKKSLAQKIDILSSVVSHRTTAALAFNDKLLALENLQALAGNKSITTACIYDEERVLFSQYYIDSYLDKCDKNGSDLKIGFTDNAYIVVREIVLDESLMGFIYIKSSLTEINQRLLDYIGFVFVMFVISSFIALLMALKLRKIITKPIIVLSETSRKIYNEKDYSIRANKITNDEVGHLVDTFNDMLGGIEKRDIALVDARDNLEIIVKERTRKLKEAQNELIRNERMAALGQLTATVSHEIRNPLGTIRTSIFTLANKLKNKSSDLTIITDRIERNIIRCDNIITELLDFSRIRALKHEKKNLSIWMHSIISEIEIHPSINLQLNLNDNLDVEIDCDLLQRVMINVIENACQAICEFQHDEKVLQVQSALSNSRTEIIITDTGGGVPDDVYPHIFEPLYSTKGFGIGLGLPVVKQIMEQHGGGVEITSIKNTSTKVTLWLPSALTYSTEVAP